MSRLSPELRAVLAAARAPYLARAAALADLVEDPGERQAERRRLAELGDAAAVAALARAGARDVEIAGAVGWTRSAIARERKRLGIAYRGVQPPAPVAPVAPPAPVSKPVPAPAPVVRRPAPVAPAAPSRVAELEARVALLEAQAAQREREARALAVALAEEQARRAAGGAGVRAVLRAVALRELAARGPQSAAALWAPILPASGPGAGWLAELGAAVLRDLEADLLIHRPQGTRGRWVVWALR